MGKGFEIRNNMRIVLRVSVSYEIIRNLDYRSFQLQSFLKNSRIRNSPCQRFNFVIHI